jgi:hypothetical protein
MFKSLILNELILCSNPELPSYIGSYTFPPGLGTCCCMLSRFTLKMDYLRLCPLHMLCILETFNEKDLRRLMSPEYGSPVNRLLLEPD